MKKRLALTVASREKRLAKQGGNAATVYLSTLRPSGRRGMVSRLRKVCKVANLGDPATVPWDTLRFEHVAAIRTKLQEAGDAPASVNLALSALRGVARAAFNLRLISAEELERIKAVKNIRNERLPRGRALGKGELAALAEACDPRDLALLACLYIGGLRRAEVAGLDLADYNQETGELKVRGKGGKERIVYLRNSGAEAMRRWLALRGLQPAPLFLHVNKAGRVVGKGRITAQAVYSSLKRRARDAGLQSLSPHDLRRSFVGDLLDAGADISTVQRLAGHANISTTARYDRRGEDVKKAAAGLLHLPIPVERKENRSPSMAAG
jgi:site-specific recombinase XerC